MVGFDSGLKENYLFMDDFSIGLYEINKALSNYELIVLKAISGCPSLMPYERVVINELDKDPVLYSLILSLPINPDELTGKIVSSLSKINNRIVEVDNSLTDKINACEDMIYLVKSVKEFISEEGAESVNDSIKALDNNDLIRRLRSKINGYYCKIASSRVKADLMLIKEVCYYLLSENLAKG
ncbi:MAG TPA: hypothetical protein VI790_00455 [Candidatus Nanoarchaeia archaeon]|nr:hypothetical protein [Candidatus Nanoarchaeia archaeon]